jgi:hypothetical protein
MTLADAITGFVCSLFAGWCCGEFVKVIEQWFGER